MKVCPQSCSGFVFTFHVWKGELGKERPRTKPCHLPWLVNSSLMCAMLWQAEQGEGEGFSVSEQGNKVPPCSADSHFSEG